MSSQIDKSDNAATDRITRRQLIGRSAACVTAASSSIACATNRVMPTNNSENEFVGIQTLANQFRTKYDVPLLSVAISKNEKLVYAMGFGNSDLGSHAQINTENLFRIASVSKPITSTTIFKLVEAGKIKITDKVFGAGSVLGLDYGVPSANGVDAITVLHLLTHTAGGWQNDGEDPMFHHVNMNHHDLIKSTIANLPLKNVPGTNFAYSNFGYCILGRVIEKLTGQSYAAAAQKLVLGPSGIKSMRIGGDTEAERAPNEVAYDASAGNPYGMKIARMDSHGGWLATPTDLVKFLTRVDGFNHRSDILKPDSIRTMTTGSEPSHGGYACGWSVNRAINYWHNGSLPGTASIAVRTAGGYCWAAITNVRRPGTPMEGDLDRLMWNMVGSVKNWPTVDLFA